MNNVNITALELSNTIKNALAVKLAAHLAAKGVVSIDVENAIKKLGDIAVAQFLLETERESLPEWLKTAPVKSIKRCANFLFALATRDASTKKGVTLGNDLIVQALILGARATGKSALDLELVKYLTTVDYESTVSISDLTKGRNVLGARRLQKKGTTDSMLSNRVGRNGYLQFLGMVSRSDTKQVVIDKQSPFYKIASGLISVAHKGAPVDPPADAPTVAG